MSDTTQVTINGKTIDLKLTVGRVLFGAQNGSDLGELETGPISTMFLNPTQLGRVVWDVYRDKLQEAGVESDSQFYDSLDGPTLRKIEAAIRKGIKDFFPWGSQVLDEIERRINNLNSLMSQASGQSSGELQESLESTQAG